MFAHPRHVKLPAGRCWDRPANSIGGGVRVENKFRKGYVGMTTMRIFRGLRFFGNSIAVDTINAGSGRRRNTLRSY